MLKYLGIFVVKLCGVKWKGKRCHNNFRDDNPAMTTINQAICHCLLDTVLDFRVMRFVHFGLLSPLKSFLGVSLGFVKGSAGPPSETGPM